MSTKIALDGVGGQEAAAHRWRGGRLLLARMGT